MRFFVSPLSAAPDPNTVDAVYRFDGLTAEVYVAHEDTWRASPTALDAATGMGPDVWSCGTLADEVDESQPMALVDELRSRAHRAGRRER